MGLSLDPARRPHPLPHRGARFLLLQILLWSRWAMAGKAREVNLKKSVELPRGLAVFVVFIGFGEFKARLGALPATSVAK